jgi:hypothetical protein
MCFEGVVKLLNQRTEKALTVLQLLQLTVQMLQRLKQFSL